MLVLLQTMVPTLYTLDSAEFAIAAETLGIPHAPGYGLYVVVAHGFAQLPVRDVSYRVNLFSAVSLALTAPLLYGLLFRLTANRLAAASATLMCVWSYYVWSTGIVAEVYAPQMMTLALSGLVLVARLTKETVNTRDAVAVGAVFGLALAMHPASVLFAPGMVVVFRRRGVTWRASMLAALAGVLVVAGSLLYFPLRYTTDPVLNLAGTYDANGVFQPVNLSSLRGIAWLLSGQQFHDLFFASGNVLTQLAHILELFWANYLGVGVILGGIGCAVIFRTQRALGWVWLVFALPYGVFYASYGASDYEAMLGPVYLLWAVMIAYGLQWVLDAIPSLRGRVVVAGIIPAIFLVVNFPLLDLSTDTSVRDKAERILVEIPPDAIVFGSWWDIVPLQYLQFVEEQRSDIVLRNLFLFDEDNIEFYWSNLLSDPNVTLVLVGTDTSVVPPDVPVLMMPLHIQNEDDDLIVAGLIFTGRE